jgi:hypothetical protein
MKHLYFLIIICVTIGCGDPNYIPICENYNSEFYVNNFLNKYANGEQISIAVIGDSTSMGFGANGGPNTWSNGLSYAFLNDPKSLNLDPESEFYLGADFPYISQENQDKTGIPSAIRLLRTEVESKNNDSKVYNYSGSGWIANTHLLYDTVSKIARLFPKPDIVLINLGINSAKKNCGQKDDMRELICQVIQGGMTPVLVKPNNIGVAYSPDGSYAAASSPDEWFPMDNWPEIREEIDQLSDEYNLEVIDLGSDDGFIDITLYYDSFHPSAAGYQVIFEKYNEWMNN